MINVDMKSSEGVVLDTTGKYCPDNIKVVPVFDFAERARRWDIVLPEAIEESTTPIVVDEWLKQHRTDDNLVVLIFPKGDLTSSDYRNYFISICGNTKLVNEELVGDNYCYGFSVRANGTQGSYSPNGTGNYKLSYVGNPYGGKLKVLDDGGLYMTLKKDSFILARGGVYCNSLPDVTGDALSSKNPKEVAA